MKAISLFSCIGVAEYYLKSIGINVVIASDIDKKRCEVHKFLYPDTAMVCGDIKADETKKNILEAIGKQKIDVVISTPPCQGMSSVGKNRSYTSLTSQTDERNFLITESFKIIDAVRPSYILFENIPRVLK
ncbi:MAG: DNA cytosine methyltransferase, partial [Prevotella sp.]|nr:DNA cytosine methyltransferase [Prevotella sp.]